MQVYQVSTFLYLQVPVASPSPVQLPPDCCSCHLGVTTLSQRRPLPLNINTLCLKHKTQKHKNMKKTETLFIPQCRTHHIKTLTAESVTPKYKHTVLNTQKTQSSKQIMKKIERLFIQKYRTHHIKALPVEAVTPKSKHSNHANYITRFHLI